MRLFESREQRTKRIFEEIFAGALRRAGQSATGSGMGAILGCIVGGSVVAMSEIENIELIRKRWGNGDSTLGRRLNHLFAFAILSRFLRFQLDGASFHQSKRVELLDSAGEWFDLLLGEDAIFSRRNFLLADQQFNYDVDHGASGIFELALYSETALQLSGFDTGLSWEGSLFPVSEYESLLKPSRKHGSSPKDVMILAVAIKDGVQKATLFADEWK